MVVCQHCPDEDDVITEVDFKNGHLYIECPTCGRSGKVELTEVVR